MIYLVRAGDAMRRLLFGTVIAVGLSAVTNAQDATKNGGANNSQQTDSGTAPSPQSINDAPLPAGFQENGANADFTWTRRWNRSAPLADGSCSWQVHTDVTYRDGRTAWFERNEEVSCEPED